MSVSFSFLEFRVDMLDIVEIVFVVFRWGSLELRVSVFFIFEFVVDSGAGGGSLFGFFEVGFGIVVGEGFGLGSGVVSRILLVNFSGGGIRLMRVSFFLVFSLLEDSWAGGRFIANISFGFFFELFCFGLEFVGVLLGGWVRGLGRGFVIIVDCVGVGVSFGVFGCFFLVFSLLGFCLLLVVCTIIRFVGRCRDVFRTLRIMDFLFLGDFRFFRGVFFGFLRVGIGI